MFFSDTSAHDSLVAHQKELKKAQLVDDLNEKIFFRPGVFELVEKNILPADDSVTEALKGGFMAWLVSYKKQKKNLGRTIRVWYAFIDIGF